MKRKTSQPTHNPVVLPFAVLGRIGGCFGPLIDPRGLRDGETRIGSTIDPMGQDGETQFGPMIDPKG